MITNGEIASLFEEMADLLELSGQNAFRIRAYRNGAKALAEMTDSAAQWILDGKDLTAVEGIGDTLAEKTKVLVETGAIPQLDKLRTEVPPSLRTMMAIPGVGAKKAMKLYQELQIADLASLREACENGLVAELKGFGAKTQSAILANMSIVEKAASRLLMDEAEDLAGLIRDHMKQCSKIERMEFAGSYRRGRESIGDLDVLVTSSQPEVVMEHFSKLGLIQEIIQRGDTKMSVRVRESFQVDLRVVEDSSWGAALQYFTGSKEHNVKIRGLAKDQGLKINEYGVFRVNSTGKSTDSKRADSKRADSKPAGDNSSSGPPSSDDPERNDPERIAGGTEEEIYKLLGLPFVPPELREDRFEFDTTNAQVIKNLVQLGDIRGDLHMHTHATDGENSIEEMVAGAKARGLQYIAITDHSKRVSMARGLDESRLLEQWKQIDALNQNSEDDFWIFKGVECDILENGEMDLSDDCLAQADWVIASIHYGQRQSIEQITERILNAIKNPWVHAIGHPTGRLLGRREAYQVDLRQVMEAAKEYGKALELNANPQRLDLNDIHVMAAAELNIPITINTDAHSIPNLDYMKFGVQQARRAGLSSSQVINSLSLAAIKKRLSKKRNRPMQLGDAT